jgi:hypothetical protein
MIQNEKEYYHAKRRLANLLTKELQFSVFPSKAEAEGESEDEEDENERQPFVEICA